jgi:hypothetical protein
MWLARATRQPSSSRWPRKRPGAAWGGGKVYDLLTLKCAMKASAERVYALNLTEFTRLAPPELKERLGTVS